MRLAFASRLWKWLANSPPIYRTVLGTVLEQFSGKQSSPLMEIWKRLANSPPIYRIVLEQFSGKQSSPLMETVGKQSSNL
jgi:hypothetical protein